MLLKTVKILTKLKTKTKNEQSLQIQPKLLQEQISKLKSIEKSKTKTQEYINRKTEKQNKNPVSNVVVRGHIAMVNAQQKAKIVENAENQFILIKFVSLLILTLLIMKMIMLSNTLIVEIFLVLRQVCKIPKFNYKSS